MKRAISSFAIIGGTALLAGCGTTNGTPPPQLNPVLGQYQQTTFGQDGIENVADALGREGGAAGFGATSGGASISNNAGSAGYTTGSVGVSGGLGQQGSNATFTVGGQSYALGYAGSPAFEIGSDVLGDDQEGLNSALEAMYHAIEDLMQGVEPEEADKLRDLRFAMIAAQSDIFDNYSIANTIAQLQVILSAANDPLLDGATEFRAYIGSLIGTFQTMQSHVAGLPSYATDLYLDEDGNGLVLFSSDYVSVAALLNDIKLADDGGIDGLNGYSVLISGLETPVSDLPTSVASYDGIWYAASQGDFSQGGGFSMDANFSTSSISGSVWDWESTGSNPHTTVSGTISGSQFSGTTEAIQLIGMDGEIIGAFYGPSAQEIAGIGAGTTQGAPVSAVFVGSQ